MRPIFQYGAPTWKLQSPMFGNTYQDEDVALGSHLGVVRHAEASHDSGPAQAGVE